MVIRWSYRAGQAWFGFRLCNQIIVGKVWYDLRGATDLNSLDKVKQTKIWSPELSFTNAKIIGGSRVDSISSTLVLRVSVTKQFCMNKTSG